MISQTSSVSNLTGIRISKHPPINVEYLAVSVEKQFQLGIMAVGSISHSALRISQIIARARKKTFQ